MDGKDRIYTCFIKMAGLLFIGTISSGLIRAETPERLLHFSPDYSIGEIHIENESIQHKIKNFDYHNRGSEWHYLTAARGDVTIQAGHRVKLVLTEEVWKNTERAKDLTKLNPDAIYTLTLMSSKSAVPSDWLMPHIISLTGLKELYLHTVKLSGKSLESLKQLTELELLWSPDELTNSGLKAITTLKTIKSLTLSNSQLSDKSLILLKEMPQLEELTLSCKKLTDDALPHIAALPKLNWLCLSGNFSDRSMISLTECPSLKLLEIHIESFSDKGMRYISQIPSLEGFKAHWMEKITNEGVSYLKSVSNLKKLDIKHAAITEQALHDLGTMTSLEYLMLPDQFTDSGVEMLSGLKNLNFLWINTSSNSTLSNRSMKVVSGFPLLEELHISGTNINDEGIRQLNQLKMLRVLNLCMINLTDQSFKSLDGLKKLERITFYPPIPLSTNGLNHLNPLTALKNINCHNTTKGTQPLNLSGLKHLESLILIMDQDYKKGPGRAYRSLLGDEDVKFLEKLETLDEFHLLGAELSNAGFKSIAGLPKLHWLKLSGPLKIADADFSVFPLDSPIINISIDFGHFTGTCLDHLTKLKYLRQLELTTDTRLDNNRINKFKNDSQIQHIKFTPRK